MACFTAATSILFFYLLHIFCSPPKRLLSEECEADSEGTEEEMEDEEGETASQVTPRRGTPVTIASLQCPTPPPRIEQNPTWLSMGVATYMTQWPEF